jgi:hypothetical protein
MKSFCILEQGGGTGAALTEKKKRLFNTDFSGFYRLNWKTMDDPDAFIARKGIVWSEGRSLLYDQVPKDYEYYIFIDDDVDFYCVDGCADEGIALRIKSLLDKWKPLGGTFYDPDCWLLQGSLPFRESMEKEAFPIAAFDFQSFIMHRSLCETMLPIWTHGSNASMRYVNYLTHLIAPRKQICFTSVLAANTEHLLHESVAKPQHNPGELLLYRQDSQFKSPGLLAFDRSMRRHNLNAWKQTPDPFPAEITPNQVLALLKQENTFQSRTVTSSSAKVGFMTKFAMILGGASTRPPKQTLKLLAKLIARSGRID